MADVGKKVIYHGKLMDEKGKAFIQACEAELGYELTIVQGNYNPGGVSQSAGTHDGGGMFDLSAWDRDRKLRVIKDKGGFGWFRPTIAGLWNEHLHVGIINHGTLSSGAQKQQVQYLARRSGLVSNAYDGSYRAEPRVVFQYPVREAPKPPKVNNVTKARDALVESIHAAGETRALLMNAPKDRAVVWAEVSNLEYTIERLKATLDNLPKR